MRKTTPNRSQGQSGTSAAPDASGNPGDSPPADRKDFDKALAELEKIVQQLESGNVPLDKSLELFQRGIELARQCKQRLDAAELRVSQLTKDKEGLFQEEAFEPEAEA